MPGPNVAEVTKVGIEMLIGLGVGGSIVALRKGIEAMFMRQFDWRDGVEAVREEMRERRRQRFGAEDSRSSIGVREE